MEEYHMEAYFHERFGQNNKRRIGIDSPVLSPFGAFAILKLILYTEFAHIPKNFFYISSFLSERIFCICRLAGYDFSLDQTIMFELVESFRQCLGVYALDRMKELTKPILLQQNHVSHNVERIALTQKFQTCIYRTGFHSPPI